MNFVDNQTQIDKIKNPHMVEQLTIMNMSSFNQIMYQEEYQ